MMALVYGFALVLAFSLVLKWAPPKPQPVKRPSWKFVLVWSIVMLTVVTVLAS